MTRQSGLEEGHENLGHWLWRRDITAKQGDTGGLADAAEDEGELRTSSWGLSLSPEDE